MPGSASQGSGYCEPRASDPAPIHELTEAFPSEKPLRRLILRLIALATLRTALVSVAVGCKPLRSCDLGNDSSGIPRCPISTSYLDQRPMAHLAYPGSKVIRVQEAGEEVNWDGNTTAFVESALTVDAAPTAIRDWYVSKFKRIGWKIPALDPLGWTSIPGSGDYLTLNFGRLPREGSAVNIVLVTRHTTKYSYNYSIGSGGWRG